MGQRFVEAHLRAAPEARPFLPLRFDDPALRARAVASAAARGPARGVMDGLTRFTARLPKSDARQASLTALAEPGTTCVVTGQQVGLFGGPLYTVYKAATAVVTARALAAQTGRRVVPVFWLQTEDHDLAEVATAYLPGGDAPLALRMPADEGHRISLAQVVLGPEVSSGLTALEEALSGLPFAVDTLARLRASYRPSATWAEAFTHWLADLFAQEGLLFFDPRAPELAPLAAPLHRRAFFEREAIAEALTARAAALTAAGFAAPVHIRPGAPLSFVHPDGPKGPRFRIAPTEGGFELVGDGRIVTRATLEDWLQDGASRWSTSALLRPVLQDSLLPVAAYVGGPGEIDYYAQIDPLHTHFELPRPLIVPRARFVALDDKQARALDALGLTPGDMTRPLRDLEIEIAPAPAGPLAPDEVQSRLTSSIAAELGPLAETLRNLEPNLDKAVERTRRSMEHALGKLLDKYRAALSRSDGERRAALTRLRAQIAPLEAPQERVLCLAGLGARIGDRPFVEQVLTAIRPYHAAQEVLRT